MKTGVGLLMVTIGATMRFAIDDEWDAVDLPTVGLILMIVGGVAFLVAVVKDFTMRPVAPPTSAPPPAAPTPPHREPPAPANPPPPQQQ